MTVICRWNDDGVQVAVRTGAAAICHDDGGGGRLAAPSLLQLAFGVFLGSSPPSPPANRGIRGLCGSRGGVSAVGQVLQPEGAVALCSVRTTRRGVSGVLAPPPTSGRAGLSPSPFLALPRAFLTTVRRVRCEQVAPPTSMQHACLMGVTAHV